MFQERKPHKTLREKMNTCTIRQCLPDVLKTDSAQTSYTYEAVAAMLSFRVAVIPLLHNVDALALVAWSWWTKI